MATNKSDEHQALAVTYQRNQLVVVAFDVEHDTLVSNERSVSVSCLDIGRRMPFGSARPRHIKPGAGPWRQGAFPKKFGALCWLRFA